MLKLTADSLWLSKFASDQDLVETVKLVAWSGAVLLVFWVFGCFQFSRPFLPKFFFFAVFLIFTFHSNYFFYSRLPFQHHLGQQLSVSWNLHRLEYESSLLAEASKSVIALPSPETTPASVRGSVVAELLSSSLLLSACGARTFAL